SPSCCPLSHGMLWDGRILVGLGEADSARDLTIGPLGEKEWPALRMTLGTRHAKRLPAFIGRTLPAFRQNGVIVSVPSLGYDVGGPAITLRFADAGLSLARQVHACDRQPF